MEEFLSEYTTYMRSCGNSIVDFLESHKGCASIL